MAEDVRDTADPETPPEVPETPAASPDGPQLRVADTVATYHIFLWPEPPGTPPTYLCLLCPSADMTEAEVQAHVTEVHGATPVPTPMAAQPPIIDEATGLLVVPRPEGSTDG